MATIPVGAAHEPQTVAEVGTEAQRTAVLAIVAEPDFDFACYNPFHPEVSGQPDLWFLWYKVPNPGATNLQGVRLDPEGNVVHRHGG